MYSLKQHHVYKLVNISSVPKGEKIIGSRFVFKQEADGRFKARLVVLRHAQEPEIDNGRSYAPVCHIGSIRTLLAIACEHGWPVWEMDVMVVCSPSSTRTSSWSQHRDMIRGTPRLGKSWSTSLSAAFTD